MNETVNPANGSVSVRIDLPVPPGRKLTVPFSIAYDSNGQIVLEQATNGVQWVTAGTASGTQGGWSYSFPFMTYQTVSATLTNGSQTVCTVAINFMYSDASGSRHPMMLSNYGYAPGHDRGGGCAGAFLPDGQQTDNQDPLGTDQVIQAYTPAIPASPGTYAPQKVTVVDADGTVVNFPSSSNTSIPILPTSIEDRNGNVAEVNGGGTCLSGFSGYTDTLGRAALSISCGNTGSGGTDTITVDGLSASYYAYYSGSASLTNDNLNVNDYSGSCSVKGLDLAIVPLSTLTLPDGTSYTFSYDPTYGLLDKITYPSGAYVRYVWGVNSQSEAGSSAGTVNNNFWSCSYAYDTPAITDRYVSYNGSTEVLHQHFSYSTTWGSGESAGLWNSKSTTVTTYDEARGGSYQTVYNYGGIYSPIQPNTNYTITNQIAVESSIQYSDWNGSVLRTVNKDWWNQYAMFCESTTEGGLTSRVDYQYSSPGPMMTDKKEWDWGQQSACPSTYQAPSGTPARETVISYNSYSTPLFTAAASIHDRPSQVIVYGNGSPAAQTNYTYDSPGVQSAGETEGRDSQYNGNTSVARGNLTAKSLWLNTTGGDLSYTMSNDDTGQMLSSTDPNGNATQYAYSGSYYGAYLTKITNALGQTESFTYNLSSGELASSTDENSQTTSYTYSDPFARLTQSNFPDGGQTTLAYNDTGTTPSVMTTRTRDGNSGDNIVTTAYTDGLAHPIETVLNSDPAGADYTVTTLDGQARSWTVTNPYRSTSDSTYGVTTYTYDALGRANDENGTKSIVRPDGSTVSTVNSANCVTVTDEMGIARTSCFDGLGRISSATDATGTVTYTHDALNNLVSVTQGGQTRTFNYDSLSRLSSASNPENGTTSYTYDGDGNLVSRTDARNVSTYYGYDALNRLTGKSYSDSTLPWYAYQYDLTYGWGASITNPVGHLSQETAWPGSGSNVYNSDSSAQYWTQAAVGFDAMERPTGIYQCMPSGCGQNVWYKSVYTYDYLGNRTSMAVSANPTPQVMGTISWSYDSAEHLTGVTGSLVDSNHPANLLSNFSYGAVGLTGVTLGNGVGETRSYNNRTWLTSVSSNPYSLSLSYYGNGDLNTGSDSLNGAWTYTYDSANRLYQAYTTDGSGKSLTYGYDQYGNASCTAGSQNVSCNAYTFNSANNQLSGYSYDAAGNLLSDGNCSYTYDGEERMNTATCGGTTTTYIYDAEGRRVAKAVGSSTTEEYVHDVSGQTISVYGPYPTQNWLRGEIYADGRHVATYTNGTTYFTQADELGTERARTDVNGYLCGSATSQPFGDNASSGGCFTMSPNFFTGQESDPETGLTYLHARYDNNRFYRLMTPDPHNAGADPADPQTWNMYAYTRNNPTTLVDPSGLCVEDACVVELTAVGILAVTHVVTQWMASPQGQESIRNTANLLSHAVSAAVSGMQSVVSNVKSMAGPTAPNSGSQGSPSQPQVPAKAPDFVGDAGGNLVNIPPGSVARPADNGNGTVYQPPVPAGAHPDTNAVRVMGPTAQQPTGSITVHGPTGQPINPSTGKPDTRANTHTPIVPTNPAVDPSSAASPSANPSGTPTPSPSDGESQ